MPLWAAEESESEKRLLLDELLTLAQVAKASESILLAGGVVSAGLGVEPESPLERYSKEASLFTFFMSANLRFLLPPVAPIASPPA